jgi:hypothetical protein
VRFYWQAVKGVPDQETERESFYQHKETNVMHFMFSLLRIRGLYMFRGLLAHRQEALHNRHLVYCVVCVSLSTAPQFIISQKALECNTETL